MSRFRWSHLNKPDLKMANDLSSAIRAAEVTGAITLPNLRSVNRLIIASDYRTPDRKCDFHVMTFLIMGAHSIYSWESQRRRWRQRHLPDGRRLAFSNLGSDKLQRKASVPFLEIANGIDGLVATVAIHKDIRSIFTEGGQQTAASATPAAWKHWKSAPFENALRVIHFESLFLAGLSRDGQEVICISDNDQIVEDARRVQDYCDISNIVTPAYVPHRLTLKTATTKQDDGMLLAEDLAAIPDLVAGALGDVLTEQSRRGVLPNSPIVTFVPPDVQEKSQQILAWYIDDGQPLRRLLLRFTPGSKPSSVFSGLYYYREGNYAPESVHLSSHNSPKN
jgi:hypothetical protein